MDVVKVDVKHPKEETPIHPSLKETSGTALGLTTLLCKTRREREHTDFDCVS